MLTTEEEKPLQYDEEKFLKVAQDLQSYLNGYFKQWNSCLPIQKVFLSRVDKYRAAGFTSQYQFAEELERRDFIRILFTPSGTRFVFSTNCGISLDEMKDHVLQLAKANEERTSLLKHNRYLRRVNGQTGKKPNSNNEE